MAFDKMKLIGLTPEEASAYCSQYGKIARVVIVDGQPKGLDAEYISERFNLVVRDNLVVMFKMG